MNHVKVRTESWFTQNLLKLNIDKAQDIIFTTKPGVSQDTSVKLLGITLDSKLNWQAHILSLKGRLSSVVFLLNKLKAIVSTSTLLTVYHSLFHCQVSYGVYLWGNASDALSIFRLQKKAVRVIEKAGFRDHCKPLFTDFGIMTLPSLYIFYQLLEIHKNRDKFNLNSFYHNYATRTANLIRVPGYRIKKSESNSLNIRLYNILPDNVKNNTLNRFKFIVKKFLLKNAFYSIGEYMQMVAREEFVV